MSTDKGESNLDVFNDLKPHTPDGIPITETKKTLMGIPVPEAGLVNRQGGNPSMATPRAPALSPDERGVAEPVDEPPSGTAMPISVFFLSVIGMPSGV